MESLSLPCDSLGNSAICREGEEPEYAHTSPQHLNRIVGKHWIMADEDCLFRIGLDNQQPVKWVLVIRREVLQGQNVLKDDRQHLDIVGLLLVCNHLCQGKTQVEFAQL